MAWVYVSQRTSVKNDTLREIGSFSVFPVKVFPYGSALGFH